MLRTLCVPKAAATASSFSSSISESLSKFASVSGLLREDGHGPAALLRDNRLVIPVSAFDQPDGKPAPVFPRPGDNRGQVGFAILR